MKTNFVLFSLFALSNSPLFCASAEEQQKNQLINLTNSIRAKRNGNTVAVTVGGAMQTLDLNNTRETFFGDLGVQIRQDNECEGDIILEAFVKDSHHVFDKRPDTTFAKKMNPIIFFLRLRPQ